MEERINSYILETKNVSKAFPGVQALKGVDFNLKKGEIHALVGENGAGKSTLIKILSGIHPDYDGNIIANGKEVNMRSVSYSRNLGIAYVPQEIDLMNNLSIAENIFAGKYPSRFGFINWKELKRKTNSVKKRFGGIAEELSNDLLVEKLSIAEKQLIEILKALVFDIEVVCMDEPTSSLTKEETNKLFELLMTLKNKGIGVIYVSHKLEEVFQLADRITVLKDGRLIKTLKKTNTNQEEIANLMVGRDLSHLKWESRKEKIKDDYILEIKDFKINEKMKNFNFKLRVGEIHGWFGLIGAGRSEFAKSIFGLDKFQNGEIKIFGEKIKKVSTKYLIKKGIGLVPEDRHEQGLILNMNILNNINMVIYGMISKLGFIKKAKERENARGAVKTLNIKTKSLNTIVNTLSGGNQQKVVIAKWLSIDSHILIFDEPTRGIDVGSKDEIYRLIRKLADEGKSIILISSEIPEIINLCDRISIFREGSLIKTLENHKGISEYEILKYAIK